MPEQLTRQSLVGIPDSGVNSVYILRPSISNQTFKANKPQLCTTEKALNAGNKILTPESVLSAEDVDVPVRFQFLLSLCERQNNAAHWATFRPQSP